MSHEKDEAGKPDQIAVPFSYARSAIGEVFSRIAKFCHGPGLDIPNERLEIRDLTVTFNCSFGHLHKFCLTPKGPEEAAFVGSIIQLAKADALKACKPLLYGADGRAMN